MTKFQQILAVTLVLHTPLIGQTLTDHWGNRTDASISQAETWMRYGLYRRAQHALEHHLRTTPPTQHHVDALFLLTLCYIEDQRFEQAYNAARVLLDHFPVGELRSLAWYFRGLSAYQTMRFDAAVEAFSVFLTLNDTHPQRGAAYFWRGLAHSKLGNWRSTQQDARQALQLKLQPATNVEQSEMGTDHALYLVALAHEHDGEFSLAAEHYQRLLMDYPASTLVADATIRLASLALQTGNSVRAAEFLAAVKPRTPRQREEWLLLAAEVESAKGQFHLAHQRFGDLLRQFPNGLYNRYARYGLAWASVQLGMREQAREEFRRLASGSDSLAHRSLYQSGLLALLQGDIVGATQAFEDLVTRFPYDDFADNAHYQLGLIRYRSRQYAEARRHFQAAARLFPSSEIRAQAFRMWGEASIALGDYGAAHFAFTQARQHAVATRAAPLFTAEVHFKEALALYHLGRFTSSIDRFSDFLHKYPQHPLTAEAYFWHGEASFQNAKFAEAERSLAVAASMLPRDHRLRPQAMYVLAWSMFEQRRYRDAAAAYERFINENRDHELVVDATLRRADCFFAIRDYATSATLYDAAQRMKSGGQHAEYAAFQLGLSLIQRGETDRGIERLRQFISTYPQSIYIEVAQFNIAWAYFSREDYETALDEFRKFESKYPESQLMPRVLLNIGDTYYNLARFDSARLAYQRLITEFPKSLLIPDAMNGLQFSFQAEGKARQAIAVIDSLLRLSTETVSGNELRLQKADILFSQGDTGGAVLEYLELLQHNPPLPIRIQALHQLGRIYELEGNVSKAQSYYQQILEQAPDHELAPSALLAIGLLHAKQRRWNDAIVTLKDLDQRYPESPLRSEAAYHVGMALMNTKQANAAWEQFHRIIEQYPSRDVFADRSRLQLARILQARKEFQAAVDILAPVVTYRDDDIAAEAYLLRGELLFTLRQYDDAIAAFNEVIQRFSNFPALYERALLGTGETYERKNDRTNARDTYARLVEIAQDPAIKRDAELRLRRVQR
jgi:TolA-binding protein